MAKQPNKTPEAKAPEPEPKKETLPAKTVSSSSQVPDHLRGVLSESSGRGVSTARDDVIIPMAYALQKGHTQTDERDESYIEGAKPGEIWLRGSATPIHNGREGVLFQPVDFMKVWIEWKPNREGFAGRHTSRPKDAKEAEIIIEGKPRIVWQRGNENLVVETREHYGFFITPGEGAQAYMIPMSSTQHTVSRQWMALMGQFRDNRGKPLDSFAKIYRLKTVRREKDGNSWYVFEAKDERWATAEEYAAGLALYNSIAAGEKVAAPYDDDTGGGVEDSGEDRGSGEDANVI